VKIPAFFALTLLATSTASADPLAPHAVQKAAVGCWQLPQGKLTLTASGKHSLTSKMQLAKEPYRGPTTITDQPLYRKDGMFELQCQPWSQHGTFCLVAPSDAGLIVRVYAFTYNDRSKAPLVSNSVVAKCE
jgi:hypothetical protein